MPNENEDLRAYCISQLDRLGVFRDYQFMNTEAQREYRKWLERKCGTRESIERVISSAVELDAMPTIADLNRILADLYGAPAAEPELTPEDRNARAQYLRDWYAQEAREAEERRRVAQERTRPAEQRITAADVESAMRGAR